MRNTFARIFNDHGGQLSLKIIGLYLILIAANVGAWAWAFIAFRDHPVLLGTALLAYSFGLRHAVDADHIAAIDNVTRKLMQEKKRPVSVGFSSRSGIPPLSFWLRLSSRPPQPHLKAR